MENITPFLSYMSARVAGTTLRVYSYALRSFLASVNGGLATPEAAQRYLDALARNGKSPSTISTRAHAIMNWFKWKGDVNVHLRAPPIRIGEPEYLQMSEFERVVKACISQLERTLLIVLFDTAVRISELLNLELDDIDWDRGIISVIRKGGRRQEVNISPRAANELRKWIDVRRSSPKRVFMDLDYNHAWSILKKLGGRAGIHNMHPHILRHTRAIQLLRSGVPINVVSQHLGHRSITTTINIYGAFTTMDIKSQLKTPEQMYANK